MPAHSVWGGPQHNEELVLELTDFRKGVTSPADGTLGTTPTTPTYLFAATNELISIGTLLPLNWDKRVSMCVVTQWALASVQLDADELSVTHDYIVCDQNSPGAGMIRTSSQVLTTTVLTTAKGLAIGDVYSSVADIAFDDANNPFTPLSVGISLEMHLTNVTDVASAHLIGSCVTFRSLL